MATYGPNEFITQSGKRVSLRHCQSSDIDAFLVFQEKISRESTHTLQVVGRIPERAKVEAAWADSVGDPVALRIGVFTEESGRERTVAQLSFHPENQNHPWVRHNGRFGMMILQEFWGEGIGRRLLEIMESHAASVGITRIEAMVRVKNDRGVRLYTRMGYEIEGTRTGAALVDGEIHDEFYIAKHLNRGLSWLPPRLETERLILRPLTLEDAPHIFEYARNPNVSRYTLWEPHQSVKDSEGYVLDYALPHYRKETPEPWGITLKSDPDKIIGTVGLFWASKPSKSMELAYAIGEPYWGKGIVVEASRACINFVFRDLDVIRIQARCKSENLASARVMEKLGMKFEGTLRSAILHRNRHWDMHYYGVLQDEWPNLEG